MSLCHIQRYVNNNSYHTFPELCFLTARYNLIYCCNVFLIYKDDDIACNYHFYNSATPSSDNIHPEFLKVLGNQLLKLQQNLRHQYYSNKLNNTMFMNILNKEKNAKIVTTTAQFP